MNWKMIKTKKIKPLEYVFPHHLENLRQMILQDGMIKYPLIIESKNKIVLDGSHRYVFLMMEGIENAPVIEVDYLDPHVRVGTHRLHRHIINGPVNISKQEVLTKGITGNLFPPRTTRHFIPFLRPKINVKLERLGTMKKIDMKWIIADVDVQKEIEHNKGYIKELEEEKEELRNYLKECDRTKKYLKEQIIKMTEENWRKMNDNRVLSR